MTLQEEFATAKALHSADELLFLPLIEKFEELKKVLRGNFLMKCKETKWYGKVNWVAKPVISVEIEEKICHRTGQYLFIRINRRGYVIGIGQFGDLKDRLFFCEGGLHIKGETCVHVVHGMINSIEYCLENHITAVQLFSRLIKEYKKFLVVS